MPFNPMKKMARRRTQVSWRLRGTPACVNCKWISDTKPNNLHYAQCQRPRQIMNPVTGKYDRLMSQVGCKSERGMHYTFRNNHIIIGWLRWIVQKIFDEVEDPDDSYMLTHFINYKICGPRARYFRPGPTALYPAGFPASHNGDTPPPGMGVQDAQ